MAARNTVVCRMVAVPRDCVPQSQGPWLSRNTDGESSIPLMSRAIEATDQGRQHATGLLQLRLMTVDLSYISIFYPDLDRADRRILG